MKNEWRINVASMPGRLHVAVSIWRDVHRGMIELMHIQEDGEVTIQTISQDGQCSGSEVATMIIRGDEFEGIIQAFVAYSRNKGFKDSNESFAEGKLKATEKHLEDMRTLVFTPTTVENRYVPSGDGVG